MSATLKFGLLLILMMSGVLHASGATIWTGPKTTFSKSAFADPTDPANQDRITDNVWITRANVAGIYNAKTETNYQFFHSPADTEWAFGTTADIGSLTFADWQTWIDSNPPSLPGQDAVLHLISDDIYLDIKFLSWGKGSTAGGSFSYERSTSPVPEPTSTALILAGTSFLLILYQRRHYKELQ